jgi:hypothetical protein
MKGLHINCVCNYWIRPCQSIDLTSKKPIDNNLFNAALYIIAVIKSRQMRRVRSTYEGDEKYVHNFGRKTVREDIKVNERIILN